MYREEDRVTQGTMARPEAPNGTGARGTVLEMARAQSAWSRRYHLAIVHPIT